jgi:hypothetical protein
MSTPKDELEGNADQRPKPDKDQQSVPKGGKQKDADTPQPERSKEKKPDWAGPG